MQSRLPDPCCGLRLWRAGPQDPGVLTLVTFWEGIQVAEIAEGEDAGEVIHVQDMGGTFEDPPPLS